MIKKITIIFLVLLGLMFSFTVLADTVSTRQSFFYRFHLYYDNGQLSANRDFQFKYDVIPDDFTPETVTTTHLFRGEIISVKEEILSSFRFDPQKGNSSFKKGGIAVDGPYFADAAKVNFYNDKGQLLLTLDVSGSSFCNDDGICNSDVGENYDNCPNDCPRPTPSPTPSPTIAPPGFFGLGWLKLILIVAGVVLAAVVIWAIWAIIKKRKSSAGQNQSLPPPQPLL